VIPLVVFLTFFSARPARADLFGGDVAVLVQILAESIKQYYQLKQLIGQGQESMDYLRWLNAGIDNSIGLLESLPIKDEKVLADLKEFKRAMQRVESLYGQVPKSPEEALQLLQDQTVAESLRMAADFKDYSEKQERNSELIAIQAREASPRGAARMQAETSAQILRSLAQLIRLNTQTLKLQSEQLALNNKASKESVANYQRVTRDLGSGFSNFKPEMGLVRF
jgi:hypothetical protein